MGTDNSANTMNLNIVNPKHLEKQMKLVEGRMAELRAEIESLERIRIACQILLGNPVDFPGPKAPAEEEEVRMPKAKTQKAPKTSDLSVRITELLQKREPMTADEIYDELKGLDVELGSRPVQAVYATLEKHPDLFQETESGQWRHAPPVAATAH